MASTKIDAKVTLLAGGVGAARLLRGLRAIVEPENLSVVVNTGDDDTFYGLKVSPDLDTIVYTLAGLAPPGRGWGIRGDTHRARTGLDRLYGDGWFALGDEDLATHIYRTERLHDGATLSRCTKEIAEALGVTQHVLPATDQPLRTVIGTDEGSLAFQDYLVRRRGRPKVRRISYRGRAAARPAPGVLRAIARADVVVIAPSNPFVSIGPILAVPGIRAALSKRKQRTVAVSPLIAGRAVKGPLAAMLRTLGKRRGTSAIAEYYAGLAGTLVVDPADVPQTALPVKWPNVVAHDILIDKLPAARALARYAVQCVVGKPANRPARRSNK
jgi:LPPG:FO 2-phospho-L-lactate transferase